MLQAVSLAREREEALQDARQCRAEAKPLETPDTYAQAAKLQRRALMREKHAAQLATLKVSRSMPAAAPADPGVCTHCRTVKWGS